MSTVPSQKLLDQWEALAADLRRSGGQQISDARFIEGVVERARQMVEPPPPAEAIQQAALPPTESQPAGLHPIVRQYAAHAHHAPDLTSASREEAGVVPCESPAAGAHRPRELPALGKAGSSRPVPAEFAVQTAEQVSARRARVEEYRVLTRERGVRPFKAAAYVGVAFHTAMAYDRDIVAATGQTALDARRALYARLRAQGLGPHQAAHRIGVTIRTANRYEKALQGTPSKRGNHLRG